MSNLQVINHDGILVVDSRLIAEELGIQHKSFKETARTYQKDLEDLGQVSLETAVDSLTNNPETYYFLNERQTNFIMTLSRNSEIVVKAKKNLVIAFDLARKKIIKQQIDINTLITNLVTKFTETINEQNIKLNILTERTQKLDEVTQEKLELEEQLEELDQAGNNNPGSWSVIQAALNNEFNIDDNYITVDQYLTSMGIQIIDTTKLNIMRRRAANFYRTSKYINPFKNKQGRNVYSGADIEYIKSAIKSVIGYIFN